MTGEILFDKVGSN